MDPLTIWLMCLATAWLLRNACEDIHAGIRRRESPRIARSRARHQLVQQQFERSGAVPIGQAVAERVATRIANPPPAGPFRRYLGGLWADAWEDAAVGHERRRRRRAVRRARTERERERVEAERERQREQAEHDRQDTDPQPAADDAVPTRPCRGGCGVLVVEPTQWCGTCTHAADDPPEHDQDEVPTTWPCRSCGAGVVRPAEWCDSCVSDIQDLAKNDPTNPHVVLVTCQTCRAYPVLTDFYGQCGPCSRSARRRPVNGDDEDYFDDLCESDDVLEQEPEAPGPDPAPETRKETPVSAPEINGDVTSPAEALAFAEGCLDLNQAIANELDAMANNLDGEGVSGTAVQIIRDVQDAATTFATAATGARDEYARHVATQADLASDAELADTTRGTYLDAARA